VHKAFCTGDEERGWSRALGWDACRDEAPGKPRIEHTRQREVIKRADWVLDLGPEGGDKGGELVAEGTPEDVAREPRSYTGGYTTLSAAVS
jgi:hypothetical protein